MRYPELPETLLKLEEECLERWRQENLFQRTLDATADGEPFVFYEGPPTANGRPGLHHIDRDQCVAQRFSVLINWLNEKQLNAFKTRQLLGADHSAYDSAELHSMEPLIRLSGSNPLTCTVEPA